MKELPPHKHPANMRELKEQLGIEDRWPTAILAVAAAMFIFFMACAIIAGLTYLIWKPL